MRRVKTARGFGGVAGEPIGGDPLSKSPSTRPRYARGLAYVLTSGVLGAFAVGAYRKHPTWSGVLGTFAFSTLLTGALSLAIESDE